MGIKKNIWIIIAITITNLIFFSCEEETEWEFPNYPNDRVVVQGILSSDYKNQEILLSVPSNGQNVNFIPITNAEVVVDDGILTYNFLEVAEQPGTYISEEKFSATLNRQYALRVINDATLYEASTGILPVTGIPDPNFTVVDSTGKMKITWIAPTYDEVQAMYEIKITWDQLTDSSIYAADSVLLYHYTFNTLDVNYTVFPPNEEDVFFPMGSTVNVTKYSLTDDYADFLRALVAETEWQGSFFEEARGNLPGNISNNGLGYFTACSVIHTTVTAFP